ncbi:unnamed protein product [Phytomonas sp. EM1]|nr:unnamed protein product [Phytomonas sp. EM1]|eukprot:CCW61567.1 unnamed protein product [Phytomonas sp. isolate EM1]
MLRKLSRGCCPHTFVEYAPLFRQTKRFLAIRSTGFLLDGKPSNNAANTASNSADEEDRQELERERNLRERFAQKVQQSIPQAQGDSDGAKSGSFVNGNPIGPLPSGVSASMFNFFMVIMLLFPLLLLAGYKSQMSDVQSLPWRELPPATVACYLLLRSLYSRREQKRIQDEFQGASRKNPYLSFDQFIVQFHPSIFDGYRTSQAEVIAAISACLVSSKDLKFARTMLRAVGRAKDTRASVDAILDALRTDFPNIF